MTLTGYVEDKRNKGKQQVSYLTRLGKWMVEEELGGIVGGQILLITKDRKLWQAAIIHILKCIKKVLLGPNIWWWYFKSAFKDVVITKV